MNILNRTFEAKHVEIGMRSLSRRKESKGEKEQEKM